MDHLGVYENQVGVMTMNEVLGFSVALDAVYLIVLGTLFYTMYKYVYQENYAKSTSVTAFYIFSTITIVSRLIAFSFLILCTRNPERELWTFWFRIFILFSVFAVASLGVNLSKSMCDLAIFIQY